MIPYSIVYICSYRNKYPIFRTISYKTVNQLEDKHTLCWQIQSHPRLICYFFNLLSHFPTDCQDYRRFSRCCYVTIIRYHRRHESRYTPAFNELSASTVLQDITGKMKYQLRKHHREGDDECA